MADIDGRNAQRAIIAPLNKGRSLTAMRPSAASGRSHAVAGEHQHLLARAGLSDAFAEVFASISEANAAVRDAAVSAADPSSRNDGTLNDTERRSESDQTSDAEPQQSVEQESGASNPRHLGDDSSRFGADKASLSNEQSVLVHPLDEAHESPGNQPGMEQDFDSTGIPMKVVASDVNLDSGTTTAGRADASESGLPPTGFEGADVQGRLGTAKSAQKANPEGDAFNALPSAGQQLSSGESEANNSGMLAAASLGDGAPSSQAGHEKRRRGKARDGKQAVETSVGDSARTNAGRAMSPAASEALAMVDNGAGLATSTRTLATTGAEVLNASIAGSPAMNAMSAHSTPLASAQRAAATSASGESTSTTQATSRLPLLAGGPVASSPRNAANGSTQGSSPTPRSDTVARIQLIQRVSKAFQRLGSDGGSIRLRLAPAELGSVRLEMQVSESKVRARVVAETEAASSLLREHLPDLRARLESYGLKIEHFEVETEQSETAFDEHHDESSRSHPDQQRRGAQRSFTQPENELHESDGRARHADSQSPLSTTNDQRVDIRL